MSSNMLSPSLTSSVLSTVDLAILLKTNDTDQKRQSVMDGIYSSHAVEEGNRSLEAASCMCANHSIPSKGPGYTLGQNHCLPFQNGVNRGWGKHGTMRGRHGTSQGGHGVRKIGRGTENIGHGMVPCLNGLAGTLGTISCCR